MQWGPFADTGLAAVDANRGARLAERGMGSIGTSEAWPALDQMLAGDEPVVGYVPIDVRRWLDAYPETAALRSWQWLREAAEPAQAGTGGEFLRQLSQTSGEQRASLVETKVRELSGRVLRLDPARVERETPFKEMGMDSLMSLELRNRLESAFGLKLSPTLLWTYGNSRTLAGALCERLPEPVG